MNGRSSTVKLPFSSVPYSGQLITCDEEMREHENSPFPHCWTVGPCLADICYRPTVNIRRLPLSGVPYHDDYQNTKKRRGNMRTITARTVGLFLLLLLTIAIANPMPSQAHAAVQEQTDTQKYIEITEQIKARAESLRDQARDRGVDVTAANKLISEGSSLLDEAKTLLQKADYASAFKKAREAQAKFRDATTVLNGAEDKSGEEKRKDISTAIDRAADRIQRIQDVIAGITSTAENQNFIDSVRQNLGEAEKNLAEAKAAVETKSDDPSKASKSLAEANKNIEEAFKGLKLIGDWTVNWRCDAFLRGIKNTIDKVRDELDKAEKKGSKVDDLREQLTTAEESIQEAKAKLLAGDKKAALAEIAKARDILQDITKELHKRGKH